MKSLWSVAVWFSLGAAPAFAQPGYIAGMPPEQPGRAAPSWSPMIEPHLDVPGCDGAEIVEWAVIEPQRRWLVARREGLVLPSWWEHRGRQHIKHGSRNGPTLVALRETHYSVPEDPSAYASLAPGCGALPRNTSWLRGLRRVVAAFWCPEEVAHSGRSSFLLFVAHSDDLVLQTRIPPAADGASRPRCASLQLVSSLTPLRSGAAACTGRCELFGGVFHGDFEVTVFDAEDPQPSRSARRFVEVVPVGQERFITSVSFGGGLSMRLPEGGTTSMDFLGSRWAASRAGRELGFAHHTAFFLFAPGFPRGQPPSYYYDVAAGVEGTDASLERGLRFLARLVPSDELARMIMDDRLPQEQRPPYAQPPPLPAPPRPNLSVPMLVLIGLSVAAGVPLLWDSRRRRSCRTAADASLRQRPRSRRHSKPRDR